MATCSLKTLIDDSCANGFFCLAHSDQAKARAVALQLFKDISGSDATIGQLIQDACSNKFMCLNEKQSRTVALQLLCDIAEG